MVNQFIKTIIRQRRVKEVIACKENMACFMLKANGRISARSTFVRKLHHSDFKEALI
jgi:hypothetical protein